jgi:hypothetical protein
MIERTATGRTGAIDRRTLDVTAPTLSKTRADACLVPRGHAFMGTREGDRLSGGTAHLSPPQELPPHDMTVEFESAR